MEALLAEVAKLENDLVNAKGDSNKITIIAAIMKIELEIATRSQ